MTHATPSEPDPGRGPADPFPAPVPPAGPAERADRSEPTDPTDFADPAGPAYPADRADRAEPTEPADFTDPFGPDASPAGTDLLDDPDGRLGPDGEPLDPRAIAPDSLDAGRNVSLWVVAAGVVLSVAVALIADATAGASLFAFVLACCAVVRGVVRGPGPVALVVRRRAVDVTVLAGLAVTIGVLAQILPES